MKTVGLFLLVSSILSSCAGAQERIDGIRIDIRTPAAETAAPTFINGYRSAIEGQTIAYHSSHPDAGEALLVRANSDAPSITWQTDTLPALSAGDRYRLIWLAGIERIGWGNAVYPHTFYFSIDGRRVFTFTNRKDSTASDWTIASPDGYVLSFHSTMVDKYGDLFGTMELDVPKARYPSGDPLTLRVDGVDAESPEWYMVFKYSFNFSPRVRVEPVLMRDQSAGSRLLRISIDNLRPAGTVEISSGMKTAMRESLALGPNIFMVPFEAPNTTREIRVSMADNGKPLGNRLLELGPVTQRSIYLIPHTHNDIGYTDLQTVVEQKQWRYLEDALRLIDRTNEYPPDARYKWNIEILWPIESWLRQASAAKKEQFLDAVNSGRIGLNALYVNPLTGLMNAVEMSHLTDYARSFSYRYSSPITTAAISDVPGFTWGLAPALSQSGIKYFASAPNSGDRIGYVIDQWGDKPFYWESQSGSEKVLCWVAGSSYASFHQATLAKAGHERIMKLIRNLDETGYPYEIYYLPYTLGDNQGNDSTLSDYVRQWNERYRSPRLVIATHLQLFTDFENNCGSKIPVIRGDFTPYWEDGAASTAFETALGRAAADRLIQGQAIWSMKNPSHYPENGFYQAWRDVMLWDEHTWGADKSITNPDNPGVLGQWKVKQRFVLEADSLSKKLLSDAAGVSGVPSIGSAFDVWNTSSFSRSDMILLSKEQSAAGDLATDEDGKQLRTQRLSTGELAVYLEDAPPLAAKRIRIMPGSAPVKSKLNGTGSSLETGRIALSIDTRSGAIGSITWKPAGGDLVDRSKGQGVNQYCYVRGTSPDSVSFLKNVSISIIERGPLVATLRVTGDAPGCAHFEYDVRLIDGVDRIDIIDRLDKEKVREKEAIHLAFPFTIPQCTVRYDVASGVVRPEADQLAGSCKNFFSVQSWVDCSGSRTGLTWVTPDAPLVELGSINAERPWMKSAAPSPVIYSYIMNNYWHTNYKADQEGPATFRYAIYPHEGFSSEQATRHGIEQREPLIVMAADPSTTPGVPLFTITPPVVLVTSIKPTEGGGGWLASLYNPSGEDQNVSIRFPSMWKSGRNSGERGTAPPEVSGSDPSARPGPALSDGFRIAAHGTGWIRITAKRQK